MITRKEFKQIRVFLSSTFLDMQKERDALVKLFRQLAEEGRKHKISITLLDLRWGITDDQKRNGMVISTCLQEIDNSRPFFIGLIGDRYGWVPSTEEFNAGDLLLKFPDLQQYSEKNLSITEIEMRYGVLDNKKVLNSIFLLKSGIIPESVNHETLIRDISTSSHTRLFTYDSLQTLVDIVRKEFITIIDEEAKEEDSNPLARLTENQERIRYEKSEKYIKIGNYHERLNGWCEAPDSVLTVTGLPGVGKSSLISAWLKEAENKFDHVIYYFIGEDGNADSPLNIQKYFINKLDTIYGLNLELNHKKDIYDWGDDYTDELEFALNESVKTGDKLLLVLDGLDHLAPTSLNYLLIWLPEVPTGVKMLLSTSSNHVTYHALTEARNFPMIQLQEFSHKEAKEIIYHVLSHFGKDLDLSLVKKLTSNHLFRNGAILRILLDDLLAYGDHESIPAQVGKYASALNIYDFFGLIIERAEDFYGKEIVRKLLIILMLSKHGLEEADIRQILKLEPLEWSELYCGLRNYIKFADGKFTLRFPEFLEVVKYRYGNIKKKEFQRICQKIREVISTREGETAGVAWMSYLLDDFTHLHSTLAPFEAMAKLLIDDPQSLFLYWEKLEELGYSFSEYLSPISSDMELAGVYAPIIAEQLDLRLNNHYLAIQFLEVYLMYLSESEIDQSIQISLLLMIGRLYNRHGEISESDRYAAKAKEILESQSDTACSEWGELYFLQGNNRAFEGEYEKALEYHQKSLEFSSKGEYYEMTGDWSILNGIGIDLINLERYEEAIKILNQALEHASSLFTSLTLESNQIVNNIGFAYLQMGQYENAREYLEKAIARMRNVLEENNLEFFLPLSNLVYTYIGTEEFEKATEILQQMLEMLKTNKMAEVTQFSFVYLQKGKLEIAKNNITSAVRMFKKSIDVLGNDNFTPQPYQELADAYLELEKYDKAIMVLDKMDQRASRYLGLPNYPSAYALENQGYLYNGLGKEQKAQQYFQKAIELYQALGEMDKVNELREFV